jgi:hypothetical protein
LALLQGCLLFERKNQAHRCIVGGKEEEHPEGACYLYHKKNWIPVGADALDAQRRRNARLDCEELRRLQGTAPVQSPNVTSITPKRTLADTVEEFFSETKANKKHKTYLAYKKSTEYFLQSCTKPRVESVDRRDMLNFKTFFKGEGFSKRYVYNNFLNRDDLSQVGEDRNGVQKGDWPAKPERDPEEYTDEEITKLLDEADEVIQNK